MTLRRRLLLAQLATGGAASTFAAADTPFHVIVAYSAGGPADVLARQLQPIFRASLGRPVIVENMPGAAGALGVTHLLGKSQRPTVLVGTLSETVFAPLLNRALTYRPDQLKLLGPVTHVPVALIGGVHLRARTIKDLLAPQQAGSGPQTYGSYGVGSHAHLVGSEFSTLARLQLQHVPYSGVTVLLRDLLGSQVDLAFLPVNRQLQEFVDRGQLRVYGLASSRSAPGLAAVPHLNTLPEFSGFTYDFWAGLFTSRQAVTEEVTEARLALHSALTDTQFRDMKRSEGIAVAEPMTDAEADRWYSREIERYKALAERVGPSLRF